MVEKYRNYIENISKETGFIGPTLEKVERLIRILQWINSDEKLNKLLALKGGTAINTAVFNFPRLSVDIDLDLTKNIGKEEMIEQRKNIHNWVIQYLNVDEMKQAVREYLKDILVIDDNTKLFYDKFQKGIYEPRLLFDDKEIVERIKEHPMIMWKLSNK